MLDNTQDYSLISNEAFRALNAADRRKIFIETADYAIDCAGHEWPEHTLVSEDWQISDSELLAFKTVDRLIEAAEEAAAESVWRQIGAQDSNQ